MSKDYVIRLCQKTGTAGKDKYRTSKTKNRKNVDGTEISQTCK